MEIIDFVIKFCSRLALTFNFMVMAIVVLVLNDICSWEGKVSFVLGVFVMVFKYVAERDVKGRLACFEKPLNDVCNMR